MCTIRGRPCFVPVSVQAMDGYDAKRNVETSSAARETGSVDDRIDAFCHNLQTLRACFYGRICRLRRAVGLSSAISLLGVHWSWMLKSRKSK